MTDRQLTALIEKNADAGMRIAIDRYGDTVYAICANVLAGYGKEAIEEAWSDTFYKLWKYAGAFDESKGAGLKTYIDTIARNTALRLRSSGRHTAYAVSICEYETDDLADTGIDLENDFARKTAETAVTDAVLAMEEPARSIFIMRYYYCMPVKDIAEALALTAKQVEHSLRRKKQQLKDLLSERGITSHEAI
jgi:RNA polymerase sigma-70 factor (ECF subfamily)